MLLDEPAGKPLTQCRTKQIILTVYPTECIDEAYRQQRIFRKLMVQRLCWEANRQDCALTQEDLARLLYCGITSICRIIAEYRKANVFIPTRGNYCDIGPGTSHKAQAVQRYLRGASVTEISRVMAHAPQSIERYLDTFAVVASATENEGYTPRRISQLMRLSRKLVTEYVQLYTEAQLDPDSQHRLAQIALRARTLQKRAKKNGRPQ